MWFTELHALSTLDMHSRVLLPSSLQFTYRWPFLRRSAVISGLEYDQAVILSCITRASSTPQRLDSLLPLTLSLCSRFNHSTPSRICAMYALSLLPRCPRRLSLSHRRMILVFVELSSICIVHRMMWLNQEFTCSGQWFNIFNEVMDVYCTSY